MLERSSGTVLATGRYMLPEVKREELAAWERQKALGATDRVGEPDPDVFPICDRLNALPGVCTLQSCAGHVEHGCLRSAHLWLWLDRCTSREFDRRAHELARIDGIERVSRIYMASGQEITCIEFQGNERGLLAVTGDYICAFFESLRR